MFRFSHVEKCRRICFRNLSLRFRSLFRPLLPAKALKMKMIYLHLNTLEHLIKTAQPNTFSCISFSSSWWQVTTRYENILNTKSGWMSSQISCWKHAEVAHLHLRWLSLKARWWKFWQVSTAEEVLQLQNWVYFDRRVEIIFARNCWVLSRPPTTFP